MNRATRLSHAAVGFLCAMLPATFAARAAEPTKLTIFAAGTLAVPFKQVDAIFEKQNPGVVVQPQFGGSVKMAKQITDLHKDADLIAVADYNVIPKYLFAQNGKPTEGQPTVSELIRLGRREAELLRLAAGL